MGASLSEQGGEGSAVAASVFILPQSGCCTYRMPCEGTTTTMVLPAASGRHATSHAYYLSMCVVCLHLPKTHALLSCGHRCVCEECARKFFQLGACLASDGNKKRK